MPTEDVLDAPPSSSWQTVSGVTRGGNLNAALVFVARREADSLCLCSPDRRGEGRVRGHLLFSVILGFISFCLAFQSPLCIIPFLCLLTLLPHSLRLWVWSTGVTLIIISDLYIFMEEYHWTSSPRHESLVTCPSLLDCSSDQLGSVKSCGRVGLGPLSEIKNWELGTQAFQIVLTLGERVCLCTHRLSLWSSRIIDYLESRWYQRQMQWSPNL